MPAPKKAYKLIEIGEVTCLRLVGRSFGPEALLEFGQALNDIIADDRPPRIVIDLSEVAFMPTVMLGHLIAATTKLRTKNSKLRVVGVNPQIQNLFEVAKVVELFDFHGNVDAAVRSFPAS
jgi:anti-anti-sigma factor